MTVHLAVTSGIPLPVCGETLRGSFTSLHRFAKMAHLVLRARALARPRPRGLSIFGRAQGRLATVNPARFGTSTGGLFIDLGITRDQSRRRPVATVAAGDFAPLRAEECGVAERPEEPLSPERCPLDGSANFALFGIERSILGALGLYARRELGRRWAHD